MVLLYCVCVCVCVCVVWWVGGGVCVYVCVCVCVCVRIPPQKKQQQTTDATTPQRTDDVGLHLARHADHPVERLRDGEGVRHGEAALAGGHAWWWCVV